MSTFPSVLLPWLPRQICDDDNLTLANGSITFVITGTSTPKAVYSTALRTVSLGTTVSLDAAGRAPAIFLGVGGYDITVNNSAAVPQYTLVNVIDSCLSFFLAAGTTATEGGKSVSTGYTMLQTDNLITMNGGTLNFLAAALRVAGSATSGLPVTVKNISTTTAITCTPNGSDTIEGGLATYSIPAAVSPNFPTATFCSDTVSTWWITSSHGL
jgi:hypothetical protein